MWFGRGRRAWSRDIGVIEVEYEKSGVVPGFLLSVEMSPEEPLEEVPGLRDWPFRRASRSPRPKCKTLEAMQLGTQSKGVGTYDGLFVQGGLGSACVFCIVNSEPDVVLRCCLFAHHLPMSICA